MAKNVLITGGTGLVGSALIKLLTNEGYTIAVLSRNTKNIGLKSFYWDTDNELLDDKALGFADYIIHLAGESVAGKKWTALQKQKIIDSRVKTTNLLFNRIKEADKKPQRIISASAIGYYGSITSEKVFNENDLPGNDFLSDVVVKWEKSVDQFSLLGIETIKLRIGVVISKEGGALAKMVAPVKMGLGSAIGSGKQYLPWIAIDDLTKMILFAMEKTEPKPVYNAVAPEHINNYNFMKTLAKVHKRPFFLPNVPAFIMKAMFGEMSTILLNGSRVSSKRIISDGFKFKFEKLVDALR
jgi:hypothetical protein